MGACFQVQAALPPLLQSCKESSWPLRHLIPSQPHTRALTFQHKNTVRTKNKGIFLDPIFSKLLGKTGLQRQLLLPHNPALAQPAPGGITVSLHPSWILEAKLLCSHSTSIPACLHPRPVWSCGVPCLPRRPRSGADRAPATSASSPADTPGYSKCHVCIQELIRNRH